MDASPHRIGRFEIRSPIGRGGMGTLYLAWDPELERHVAIKVLNQDDEGLRARFLREARAAARLQHPHIVTVFDVGRHEGRPFMAMEYVDGFTLATVVRERRDVPLDRKLRWMEELCDGLGEAHAEGIIHRDIKPANLMIDGSGALLILDFGIARVLTASELTQTNAVLGTLNYMSPEQLSGREIDRRSDLHAVGAVLYELLTYAKAFPGSMADGVLGDILSATPVSLHSRLPDLDPAVVRIVERALAKDPAARYQEAGAMQRELAAARVRLAASSHEPQSPPRYERREAPAATGSPASPTEADSGSPAHPTMVATAIFSGTAPDSPGGGDAGDADPPRAEPAGEEPPRGDAARPGEGTKTGASGSRGGVFAIVAAGLAVAALASFALWGGGGRDAAPEPSAPAEMRTEPDPNPPALPVVDSTRTAAADTMPVDSTVDTTPPVQERTIPPDSASTPAREPRSQRDSARTPAARGPLPARCGLLLQRLSLGEELTQEERDFLARECRTGGDAP